MAATAHDKTPWWAWLFPALGLGLVLAGLPALSPAGLLLAAMLTISVFAAVLHAEVVAARLGEPYGTLILALAVTVIETALIISLMADGEHPELARDSVFASIMIALNGIVGLSLVLGGARHLEQGFAARGASAFLTVVITIAVLCLVLPNYTTTMPGPYFSSRQLIFVAVMALLTYGTFLFVMTVRHRDDFLHGHGIDPHGPKPSAARAWLAFALMLVALMAVVLLAKKLAPVLEAGVTWLEAPKSLSGVVIAALVLMPEGLSALRAAARNDLQMSLNLSLGSVLACIGLTIPAVACFSLLTGARLQLGLDPSGMVLLVLTFMVSTLTLATGRSTVLQGAVHLMIFGTFLLLNFSP
ncbi:MAG: ionic transporter y4hA [Alphaproteobacteria bacterium]|nr:ionic transporter y4hA [Alphaproteobacteria bacterium]